MDSERLEICEGCEEKFPRGIWDPCDFVPLCRRAHRLGIAEGIRQAQQRETSGLAIEFAPVEQEAAE